MVRIRRGGVTAVAIRLPGGLFINEEDTIATSTILHYWLTILVNPVQYFGEDQEIIIGTVVRSARLPAQIPCATILLAGQHASGTDSLRNDLIRPAKTRAVIQIFLQEIVFYPAVDIFCTGIQLQPARWAVVKIKRRAALGGAPYAVRQ